MAAVGLWTPSAGECPSVLVYAVFPIFISNHERALDLVFQFFLRSVVLSFCCYNTWCCSHMSRHPCLLGRLPLEFGVGSFLPVLDSVCWYFIKDFIVFCIYMWKGYCSIVFCDALGFFWLWFWLFCCCCC